MGGRGAGAGVVVVVSVDGLGGMVFVGFEVWGGRGSFVGVGGKGCRLYTMVVQECIAEMGEFFFLGK